MPTLGDQPAYPVTPPLDAGQSASGYPYPALGMTYRQFLIAAALTGLCASPNYSPDLMPLIAQNAIKHADAVLAELEQEKQS